MRHRRGLLGCILILLPSLLVFGWSMIAAQEGEDDYPHGAFREKCGLCHSAEGWTPSRISPEFKHDKGFPLLGVHGQTQCTACHKSLEFNVADNDCAGCHLDVHLGELGTDCVRCHTSRSFIDRSSMARAHLATRFPLVGSHRAVACEECHPIRVQGRMQYVNTQVDCENCHLDDYLATRNPDHQASGLPTNCALCHTPTVWRRTRDGFNHDALYFPIYSGAHRGRWQSCSDCHTSASNFNSFSCFACHSQQETNDKHSGVSGYQYDSNACYSCHPQGRV